MRLSLFTLISIPLLIACGQEKSHAVYDTDNNPDNFPPQAVEVISRIESGALVGAEAITQAFGDLLTEHGDLLDRPEWRKAVDNMGGLFRRVADSLAAQGVGSYSLAAEYYQLGLLARPEDSTVRRLSGMFEFWQRARQAESDLVNPLDSGSVETALAVARRFMWGDTLSQQFFLEYLGPEVSKRVDTTAYFIRQLLPVLPPADRALLSFAGLIKTAGLVPLTTFSPPRIDLIGARVTQYDSSSYRAELYFRPAEPVTAQLLVHLSLGTSYGSAWAVDFAPPMSAWRPGQCVPAVWTFEGPARFYSAEVGLSSAAGPLPVLLDQGNSQRELFLLSDSALIRP